MAKYDSESNWYNAIYGDRDQEDEWRELEEVLLPLDITVPLKTLVMNKCKPKVGRPRAGNQIMCQVYFQHLCPMT